MFSFLRPASLISAQDLDFQLATYHWLLNHVDDDFFITETQLVLPTSDFFPAVVDNTEDAVNETFKRVKQLAGLADWPCKLEPQEESADPFETSLFIQNTPSTPAGTFQIKEQQEIVITYNPNIANNPVQLVATFAHELAHYLTSASELPPPGGWENWEFATDIAATFLGFGIFMANSAFSFSQFSGIDNQGWKTNRSGYLSETEHVYALAIFLILKKKPLDSSLRYLKPSLRKTLKAAVKALLKSERLQGLQGLIENNQDVTVS